MSNRISTLCSTLLLSALVVGIHADRVRADDDTDPGDDQADRSEDDAAPAAPAAPATPPANPNLTAMANANAYRKTALRTAISALRALQEQVDGNVAPEHLDRSKVADVKGWLLTPPPATKGDYPAYSRVLGRAIAVIQKQIDRGEVAMYVYPDPVAVDMCDRYGATAFAWHDGKIALCEPWTRKGSECQRVVVIHEHFHAAGLPEVTNPTTLDDVLRSPDYMAGLVSRLTSGNSDRCDR